MTAWALPRALPIVPLPAGTTLARIHHKASVEPFFGPARGTPPTYRFHDPEGEFAVCYLGEDDSASFAETILHRPPVRIVTLAELADRRLSTFRLTRSLRLAGIAGAGLAQCGCTAEITSSPPPYTEPQAFSRALWSHDDVPDGIHYRCRHDNNRSAVALFDRTATALDLLTTEDLLGNRTRLVAWSDRYGFALA